ncbi:MAG: hypothetical protein KTR31_38705, partial [Myxococcales bacterium]|nr:hypothetical protein [Myxococcales bacterium]
MQPRSVPLVAVIAMFLGASCAPPPPPVSHSLVVGAGHVLAVDVQPGVFDWWILDPVTEDVIQTGSFVVPAAPLGSVVVQANDAAGIYLTTPDLTTPPTYPVSFEGTVEDQAPVSYLLTTETALEDLRADPNDGAALASLHTTMADLSTTLVAQWQSDLDAQNEALTTLTWESVDAWRTQLEGAVPLLLDGSDLDAAEAGSLGLAPWAVQAQADVDAAGALAVDDTDVGQLQIDDAEASLPDPAALQDAIEACLELDAWGDELETYVDRNFPEDLGDDDGKDPDTGSLLGNWEALEDALEAHLDTQAELAEDVVACILEAIGDEPEPVVAEVLPGAYESLASHAQADAEDARLTA